MCASCGCGKVNEDHGDPRNITMNSLQEAADAAGITAEDAARNIEDAALSGGNEGAEGEAARTAPSARDDA